MDLDWHDGRLIRARILVRRPARAREFTVPRASGKPGLVAQDTGLTVPSAQHGDGGRFLTLRPVEPGTYLLEATG